MWCHKVADFEISACVLKTGVSPLPEPCLSAVCRKDPPRLSLLVGDVLYLFSISGVPQDIQRMATVLFGGVGSLTHNVVLWGKQSL